MKQNFSNETCLNQSFFINQFHLYYIHIDPTYMHIIFHKYYKLLNINNKNIRQLYNTSINKNKSQCNISMKRCRSDGDQQHWRY